jgi:RNA polymerase sigma factor (sigma-70 family)
LLPDGQLLERYVARRDESAFTALVERYGSLVLSVCHRVLQNRHDAEDAFQATFMVLARRAGGLDGSGSLGNWLYSVAYRTALKARSTLTRRRAQERQAVDMPAPPSADDSEWEELRPLLDEELAHLPEKYRAPLVLCYLQGKSHQQAASELGWPSGSMSRRMERARGLLRDRLTRRGLALSSAVVFSLITKNASAATVPSSLLPATVKASLAFAAGADLAKAGVARQTATLAEQVSRNAVVAGAKSKVGPGLVLKLLALVALLCGGVYGGYRGIAALRNPSGSWTSSASAPFAALTVQEHEPGTGHAGAILSLAFNPGGTHLASGSAKPNPCVKIWLAGAGGLTGPKASFPAPSAVNALAFAPRALLLAAGCADGTVCLWTLQMGFCEIDSTDTLKTGSEVHTICFSHDGNTLAVAGKDQTIRLWDLATKKPRTSLSGHRDSVESLTFSCDGGLLASASADGTVRLWETATGKEHATLQGHAGGVRSVAFSPDGRTLVSGGDDRSERLWDVATGRQIRSSEAHTGPVRAVGFAFAGQAVFSGSMDQTGTIWDKATGQTLATLQGHQGGILAMITARDGELFATGGADRKIRLWKVTTH